MREGKYRIETKQKNENPAFSLYTELRFLPVIVISDFIDCFNVWEVGLRICWSGFDSSGCVSIFLLFLFFPLEAHKLFCSFSSCQS